MAVKIIRTIARLEEQRPDSCDQAGVNTNYRSSSHGLPPRTVTGNRLGPGAMQGILVIGSKHHWPPMNAGDLPRPSAAAPVAAPGQPCEESRLGVRRAENIDGARLRHAR